jgi:hypothetical protein
MVSRSPAFICAEWPVLVYAGQPANINALRRVAELLMTVAMGVLA